MLQLSAGSGASLNSACMAAALNYSVVTDAPAGGPSASALRLSMTGEAVSALTTQCVRSQFAAPLDLSTSRVLEFTIHGDGRWVCACVRVYVRVYGRARVCTCVSVHRSLSHSFAHSKQLARILVVSSGAVLDIQLQDASAGVREFFVNLTFVGWRTIRRTLPATRSMYTHAGGPIPWVWTLFACAPACVRVHVSVCVCGSDCESVAVGEPSWWE